MEQSVELMVFLGIGMILLGLLTAFIYQWSIKEDVQATLDLYKGESKIPGIKMDKVEFMAKAKAYWDWCNHTSAPDNLTMYVYNTKDMLNATFNKTHLFEHYKALSWCGNIQSVNNSCGRREDVNMSEIELPSVLRVSCRNSTLYIERG
jgi:hypothetical protein